MVLAFIQYRKHRLALIDSLDTTIKTIENGRMSQVAVVEDYHAHKRIIDDLRPYRIFDRGFATACKKYADLYGQIYRQEPLLTFMANPEVTAVILDHLSALKGKA